MRIAEASPVSAAEAKALFSDLVDAPALVLAVSGGPDSTALMWLAARWRATRNAGPKLIAVTVDHGLRQEAKAEAAAVGRLARKLGLTHRILRWSGTKPATGLQQAARQARYRLLAGAARAAGASAILTAHTLDDQAETVLLRMMRGSGVTGLGAMQRVTPLASLLVYPSPERGGSIAPTGPREARPDDRLRAIGVGSSRGSMTPTRRASLADLPLAGGGIGASGTGDEIILVRPLLDIPKSRLIATLKAAKIPFAEDPSNRDPRFTRARLRELMPALAHEGLDARRLALLARRMRRVDAAMEAAVARALAALVIPAPPPATVAVDAAGFAQLPAEVGLRLLGRALDQVGDEGPVQLAKLEALKTALDAAQTGKNARFRRSLAGAIVTLAGKALMIERAPRRRGRTLTTRRRTKARAHKAR